MNFVILLTGCVNPAGMAYTALQDKDVRLKQYISAVNWYLDNTKFPIVFCENTGVDISKYITDESNKERLESLTFIGNDYNRKLGKGYGEGLIIKYALKHSVFISEDTIIIKITGRLICENILALIKDYESLHENTILCDSNRKLTTASSRIYFAPNGFYESYFCNELHKCNDSAHYEFENALATSIRRAIQDKCYALALFKRPYTLKGISGTDNVEIKNKSWLKIKIKYILHSLKLWAVVYKKTKSELPPPPITNINTIHSEAALVVRERRAA